jgi:hypothetical protein
VKVLLWPFFSQQDKRTGQFLLGSDSAVKLYNALAKEMLKVGWEPTLVVPLRTQTAKAFAQQPWEPVCPVRRLTYILEENNLHRRLQWEPTTILDLCAGQDVVVTTCDLLPIPLRLLLPNMPIVVECGFIPREMHELFALSWKSADLVHCVTAELADFAKMHAQTTIWPLAYDDEEAAPRNLTRDVDVLFPARCSAVDYTNYKAFIKQMECFAGSVVMTDPTSYMRSQSKHLWATPEPLSRVDYTTLLHRTRVVVSLTSNGAGGMAMREAAACGALPVVLNRPEYEEVLGGKWPYYCSLHTVRTVVERALRDGWPTEIPAGIAACSRTAVWQKAKADLEAVCASRKRR